MKKITFLFLLCSILNINAQTVYNLENGTLVDLTIVDEVSSENENNFSVQVAHNIMDNTGKVIIKEGAQVKFNVERIHRKGVGRGGHIEITFLQVESADGQAIKLNGKTVKEGKSNMGKALGVGIGVGIGTLLLPMLAYMAKKGEPAKIAQNTIINNIPVLGSYQVK